MTGELGHLKRLNPRIAWQSEPQDFTPWLAEHLDLLAGALGLDEIELIEQEMSVGAFSLDIWARESGAGGRRIVIENQLEKTDHGHLGQLLLYAAGLDADIVVWVSPQFRDEYRTVLDWLNANTRDGLSFFGIEIEVLQIDDSLPAANLRLVSEPSEFQRSVGGSAARRISDRQAAYHAFFTRFAERLNELRSGFTRWKGPGYDSWIALGSGRGGIGIHAMFTSGNTFRVQLYIDVGDATVNKRVFDELQVEAATWEDELGALTWERLDNRSASRLFLAREGHIDADQETLAELTDWGAKTTIHFRDVFESRLKSLDLTTEPDPAPEGVATL